VADVLGRVGDFIPAAKVFVPDPGAKSAYDRNFKVFKKLYRANKANLKLMNQALN